MPLFLDNGKNCAKIILKLRKNEEIPMDKAKIDRINELGRISKERELTPAELAERAALREEYLKFFRASLRGNGDNNNG